MVRHVKVADRSKIGHQSRLDTLAQERRELDNRLQEHNWQATLME